MTIIRVILPILGLISSLAVPAAILAQTPPVPSASGAPAAVASPPAAHRHRHHRPFLHALHGLSLTAAQQQKVAAFQAAEQKANVGADRTTKQANAAKMRSQIMGVLTPDQQTQLQARLHHPASPGADQNPAPPPAPPHQ